MVCPCCGALKVDKAELAAQCSCGAKPVGLPLTEPEWVPPKVGRKLAAIGLALGGLLMFWIKPVGLIAAVGLYLAYRELWPRGGRPALDRRSRLAIVALVIAIALVGLDTGLMIAGIPRAYRGFTGLRYHTTVAKMERLSWLLRVYQEEYGKYPQELGDLRLVTSENLELSDFWEQDFRYQSTSLVATRLNRPEPPSNFEIRSAGSDGIFGTADDIIMQDDHIVTADQTDPGINEAAPITPTPEPKKERRR